MKRVVLALSILSVAAVAQETKPTAPATKSVVCSVMPNQIIPVLMNAKIEINGAEATAALATMDTPETNEDSGKLKCSAQAYTKADVEARINALKAEGEEVLKEVPEQSRKSVKKKIDDVIKQEAKKYNEVKDTTLVKCYGDQDYYFFFISKKGKDSRFGYDGGSASESIYGKMNCQ